MYCNTIPLDNYFKFEHGQYISWAHIHLLVLLIFFLLFSHQFFTMLSIIDGYCSWIIYSLHTICVKVCCSEINYGFNFTTMSTGLSCKHAPCTLSLVMKMQINAVDTQIHKSTFGLFTVFIFSSSQQQKKTGC